MNQEKLARMLGSINAIPLTTVILTPLLSNLQRLILLSLAQVNQEKLARMLGSINAMFLMCFRLSKLHEAGKMSHADASMVKAWTTLRGTLMLTSQNRVSVLPTCMSSTLVCTPALSFYTRTCVIAQRLFSCCQASQGEIAQLY